MLHDFIDSGLERLVEFAPSRPRRLSGASQPTCFTHWRSRFSSTPSFFLVVEFVVDTVIRQPPTGLFHRVAVGDAVKSDHLSISQLFQGIKRRSDLSGANPPISGFIVLRLAG